MVNAGSILASLWIVFWLYWVISAFGAKGSVRDPGNLRRQVLYRLAIIAFVILILKVPGLRLFFLRERLFETYPAVPYIGLALCALGLGFAVWARVHLGRNWGMPMTMRENPEFVTSGPYSLVRHPIYTGLLLAILGTSLIVGPIWILLLAVCAPYFVYGALKEEQLMAGQFPEPYSNYKKRTKMFIPFLF